MPNYVQVQMPLEWLLQMFQVLRTGPVVENSLERESHTLLSDQP